MLFNSLPFAALLGVTVVGAKVARGRVRLWVLLLASWAFYAGWDPKWLVLLLISTAVDYAAGLALEATPDDRRARRWAVLGVSLAANLGILFAFKYWDFALALAGMRAWGDVSAHQSFHVYGDLPPGLSFYTFQTLSYSIDVFRGRQRAVRDPVAFALYVAFFPQLIAGPVVRASEFFPQLLKPRAETARRTWLALELFAVGLFKKVVVADGLGMLVDPIFRDPSAASGATLLLGGLLFWGQIYADFSGYSTMARGLGKAFGVDLPRNFDFPLLATGPLAYRRSWHMTMSSWFRDYVFHPLGGSRRGPLRVALNIAIVWTAFGLWHGAGLTFAVWGLYNGVIQAITREIYRRWGPPPVFPGKAVAGWALNLALILPSAIVFRSKSLALAGVALGRVAGLADGATLSSSAVVVCGALGLLHLASKRWYREDVLVRLSLPLRVGLLVVMVWAVVLLAAESRPFVYFQF